MGKLSQFHPQKGIMLTKNIIKLYGKPFFWLNSTIFFSQVGIIYYLIQFIALPYYQKANVDGQEYIEMVAVGFTPWTCKGFFGLISDLVPIFGRQKHYYIIFYIIIGVISCVLLALLPFDVIEKHPIYAALLFFVFNCSSAACDLLVEAKYIELMQQNPNIRADLLTYARFTETVGQLLPTITVGFLAEFTDVRILFVIYFPLLLLPLPCLFYGGMIYDKVPKHKSNKIDIERLLSQMRLVILSTLQFGTAVGAIVATALGDATIQLIYTLAIALVLNFLAYILLDLTTAHYFFYMYILQAFYFNLQGALDYYYTEECAIDGPKFNYIIMNSLAPTLSTIASFFAIFIFQVVFWNWKFHSVYIASTFLRIIASMSDLVLVNGWNRVIYIPDEVVFLLGYATVSYLAYMLISITNSYMIAKLSPKNFEATMFALLSSAAHMGTSSSSYFGAFLMDIFNIVSIPNPKQNIECNFDNLSYLIIIGHAIFPALSLIPLFILVPSIRLDEPLMKIQDKQFSLNTTSSQEIEEKKR